MKFEMKPTFSLTITHSVCRVDRWDQHRTESIDTIQELDWPQVAVQTLRDFGLSSEPVLILLDSSLVLVHAIPPEHATLKQQELAFELESVLPVDVEDMLPIVRGKDQPFAIVTSRSYLVDLLEQLDEANIKVAGITPQSTLLIDTIRNEQRTVLIENKDCLELIRRQPKRIGTWQVFFDTEQLAQHVDSDARSGYLSVRFKDPENPLPEDFLPEQVLEGEELLAQAVSSTLSRRLTPEINFLPLVSGKKSTESLGAGTQLLVAVCVLLLFIATALFVRDQKMSKEIADNQQIMSQILKDTLPNQRKSQLVQRALQAEFETLKARAPLAQQSQGSSQLLLQLQKVLPPLPQDNSIELKTIEVESGGIQIEGTTKVVDRLSQIKDQLESDRQYEVDFPSYGTNFVMQVKPREESQRR